MDGSLFRFAVRPEKARALLERLERLGVREADLVERFVRASGPGGQKVNKTSSAVYIKHLPTGIEVKSALSRSQSLNRYEARRILAERLEARILGVQSAEAQRIAKLRRQKRKRSKRAKDRMLDGKRARGELKEMRRPPRDD
jgi:protein subunit release factor B